MTGHTLRWSEDRLREHQKRFAKGTERHARDRVRLVLPMPPSVNAFGKNGIRGGPKTERYKAFFAEVQRIVAEAGNPTMGAYRLAVHVDFMPPDRINRDLDNICKATLDALQKAGVYDNDCQIDDLRVVRHTIPGQASATVTITRRAEATP